MADVPPDDFTEAQLDECEAVLQYRFRDRVLLRRALTHSSVSRTRLDSNERLEFLGDAILGTIVCEALFEQYPESPEGELTRIKSVVVSRATCARLTRRLGLQAFLRLGKGVAHRDRVPGSILAAVFEAVVGAMHLDGGLQVTKEFVLRAIGDEMNRAAESATGVNYKSLLQQLSQKAYGETPVYSVLDEKGPDHSKCFKVSAMIGARVFEAAWGPSKKTAEQRAANNALFQIEGKEPPEPVD
ncbi:Ribonuclease 3 [Maioricimonas rarisocia]|uniref:Ribonuclease 3 n=1 Tax=Maioricimonas rarisocia TaxID=2528026 RepID=A0A517ZBV7_9PLAN|nr:ribonuclease III [Maioricimonas rarisocia]QDU39920.1 Ribonuclease 3 [Maioricimonas rarisocia]